ncbi:MAG TPA: helix-turn-helix transcriptional regulator [Bacilli bacterium]|nr:helix-turn-helix transcriptional regulator [Bacilli bacterium]
MNLSEKIKQARMNKNYSQEQLANLIFVTKQSISKYEHNQAKPSKETLEAMQKVLEVDFTEVADTPLKNKFGTLQKIMMLSLILINIITLSIVIVQGIQLNQYNQAFDNKTAIFHGLEVTYIDHTYERLVERLYTRLHFRNTTDQTITVNSLMISIHDAQIQNFYFSETQKNGPWESDYELDSNASLTLWIVIGISNDDVASDNNRITLLYGDQIVSRFKAKKINS